MVFKMQGHTLPGIKQKSKKSTDGRATSAPFQQTKSAQELLIEGSKKANKGAEERGVTTAAGGIAEAFFQKEKVDNEQKLEDQEVWKSKLMAE